MKAALQIPEMYVDGQRGYLVGADGHPLMDGVIEAPRVVAEGTVSLLGDDGYGSPVHALDDAVSFVAPPSLLPPKSYVDSVALVNMKTYRTHFTGQSSIQPERVIQILGAADEGTTGM